jgi:hypothetical protein
MQAALKANDYERVHALQRRLRRVTHAAVQCGGVDNEDAASVDNNGDVDSAAAKADALLAVLRLPPRAFAANTVALVASHRRRLKEAISLYGEQLLNAVEYWQCVLEHTLFLRGGDDAANGHALLDDDGGGGGGVDDVDGDIMATIGEEGSSALPTPPTLVSVFASLRRYVFGVSFLTVLLVC